MHLQHLLMHTTNMDDHRNAPTGCRLQRTQHFVHNTSNAHTTVVVHNTNDAHTTGAMRAQQLLCTTLVEHNTSDVHTTVVVHNTSDAHTTEVMRAQQCRWRAAAARVSRRPAAVEE